MSKMNNDEPSGVVAGTMDVSGDTSLNEGGPTTVDEALARRKQVRRRVEALDRAEAIKKMAKKTH